MSELERMSVTIERELLERFDRSIQAGGHANRSEAVRDLIRNRLIEEGLTSPNTRAVATVTLVYDHTQRDLADRLLEAGHHHHQVTLSTLHVHLDEIHCVEVIVLRGKARELKHVAAHLIGMKGVKHGKLVLTAAGI